LLNLAAFLIRSGDGQPDYCQGLYHYLNRAMSDSDLLLKVGWYPEVLHGWAKEMKSTIVPLKNINGGFLGWGKGGAEATFILNDAETHVIKKGANLAATYFSRLLFWADMAFTQADARMLKYSAGTDSAYASIHDTMCGIPVGNIEQDEAYDASADNAMGRILRAALVGMLQENEMGVSINTTLKFRPFSDAKETEVEVFIQRNKLCDQINEVLGNDLAAIIYNDYWPSST
jgi:hypothetical protein